MIKHDGKTYLTAAEAADRVWVSRPTISAWIRAGLPNVDLGAGKPKLIELETLIAWKVKHPRRRAASRPRPC